MEYTEEYNFDLEYQPSKPTVVVDALSDMTRCFMACLVVNELDMLRVLNEFGLECVEAEGQVVLFFIVAQPTFVMRVIEA